MAITKRKDGNTVVYSLGEETVLTASFEKGEENILKIKGAIKTLVAPCFEEVINEATALGEELTMDFSDVTYIASAGLRVLLNMQQKIDDNESSRVFIANIPENVKEVFEQTGFINILSIKD